MKCLTIAEAKAASEVFGDAADQKRGLKCSGFENPRQHRGRGRFAVRSGNHQNVFADQEFIVQNLRQRAERNAFVEQALQFDIAARECVAYDYEIRTGIEVRCGKGLRDGNAQGFEKRRHRRIGSRVRASDAETALLQHASERRHRRATDTDEVNVFFLGHLISWDCRLPKSDCRSETLGIGVAFAIWLLTPGCFISPLPLPVSAVPPRH
jgi:hypothetical protein